MKILIIKLSSLGDVIHGMPVVSSIKRLDPHAEITWLVNETYVPLTKCIKGVDKVVSFDRAAWHNAWKHPKQWAGNIIKLFSVIQELREQSFDLVLDLQCLFRSGFFSWVCKAPQRWGFDNAREFSYLFYTRSIPVREKNLHAVDQNMEMVKTLFPGQSGYPVSFEWTFPETTQNSITQKLIENGIKNNYCILAPGARWVTKQWPYFFKLAEQIEENTSLWVVVIGSEIEWKGEKSLKRTVSLAGKTTLPELAELLSRARFLVSNDSGPLHLAVAVNTPVLTLMGPTRPEKTGPYRKASIIQKKDIPCVPCLKRECSLIKNRGLCLSSISPEEVFAVIQKQGLLSSS
jgi:lipopolysaccharide heptosyltransferase I